MALFITQRVLQAVLLLFVMSLGVFVGVQAIGNPIDVLISPLASPLEKQRVIEEFGLHRPIWEQYFAFLGRAFHGDMGRSFVFNEGSLDLILQRLPATLELAVLALLLSAGLGIPLGLYAGLRPNSFASRAIMAGSIVGFSLPSFWVGMMLIMVFAVMLGWLPSTGRGPTTEVFGVRLSIFNWEGLKHAILPAINLSLLKISLVIRLTRAGVQEVVLTEYVRFARARGLTQRRIVGVHILRNILIPIVTVMGIEFGSLIAYSVVTETVFSWPGMGKLIIDSIMVLDRPVIVAYLLMVVTLFVGINTTVDILYAFLDPRIRVGGNAA